MIISYNWLKTYVPSLTLDPHQLAFVLTDIGLEVESVEDYESVKGGLKGLVIGHVIEKSKHPDADRLSITKVQIDQQGTVHQIVCGASNVEAGQKVVVALPGTTIYPFEGQSFTIKLSKIRGVESAGMICAEDEIGLGKSHEGILVLDSSAPIGKPVAEYFNVSTDKVIHIGLTPNRIDAASHMGVARDLIAALNHRQRNALTLLKPVLTDQKPAGKPAYNVVVEAESDCKKYLALEINGVEVGESPAWLKTRLESIGLRSINNIVDITNFVMHECGQPLHAFDADKIKDKTIRVRRAIQDEPFVTLDGVTRKLSADDLVIADNEKPMCLAGVFGGLESGVGEHTKNIVLESAWFNPVVVRKTSRRHELHTDSSFRFERGADPEMTLWAIMRAAGLVAELAEGKLNASLVEHTSPFDSVLIDFSPLHLNRFAGQEIPVEEVKSILTSLDFAIENQTAGRYTLKAPLYRVDVTRAVDVYEEILRIYGYNNIATPSKLHATPQLQETEDREKLLETISQLLADKGFSEIMNNSLLPETTNELFKSEGASVKLLNPLSSELDVLRNSLLFGGLQSIRYNSNRQHHNLRFFEIGNIYSKTEKGFREEQHIGIWITGRKDNIHWNEQKAEFTYYTIKGITESLISRFINTRLNMSSGMEHELLYDVLSYSQDKTVIAVGGSVKPELLEKFDIEQPVYFVSFSVNGLLAGIKRTRFRYEEVSKFPSIKRDLSLLLDEEVTFESLAATVIQTDKKLIKKVDVFDVYTGKNMEKGKKSYAVSLTISDEEKTLKDEEVEKLMSRVIKNLGEKTGAVLR